MSALKSAGATAHLHCHPNTHCEGLFPARTGADDFITSFCDPFSIEINQYLTCTLKKFKFENDKKKKKSIF
jgi:hypothetical protein